MRAGAGDAPECPDQVNSAAVGGVRPSVAITNSQGPGVRGQVSFATPVAFTEAAQTSTPEGSGSEGAPARTATRNAVVPSTVVASTAVTSARAASPR